MLEAAHSTIDGHIADLRARGSIPGLTLAITDRDGLLLDRAYGHAEIASGRLVRPDTLFEIGSIGKTFAAIVVMQLAEEGRLELDDPVVRHLPWFRVPRTGARITIRHLLGHTAGITSGIEGTPEATFQVWRLRDLAPGSGPGRRFHYSNLGYKAIGLIVETLEGQPYPDVVRRRILEPLGMSASEPAITNDIRPRLAVGYEPARDDLPWAEGDPLLPATWLETHTADGAIASTASDMAIFARMLLHDGTGPDGRLISAASFAQMTTLVPVIGDVGYGLGIYSRTFDGHRLIGHTGGMVGYLSGLWCDPEAGLAAVVLQNGPGHGPNMLARRLIRVVAAALEGRDPAVELAERLAAEFPAVDADADAGALTEVASPESSNPPDAAVRAILGTYRSHDPWTPLFRVVLRGDVPWLSFHATPDGFEDEQPLHPFGRGGYRVGDDPLGPERLRFDTVIDGLATRAWLSGWDYYRVGDA
jgi:CubicO group peptidase (beta-lactamase class C family)